MSKKYRTPEDAIRFLSRNGAKVWPPIKKKIDGIDKVFPGKVSMSMPGNGCLGAIDYLCNYHNYQRSN